MENVAVISNLQILQKHNLGIAILSIQVHIRLEWLSEDLVDG